jgi:hypothetical protein
MSNALHTCTTVEQLAAYAHKHGCTVLVAYTYDRDGTVRPFVYTSTLGCPTLPEQPPAWYAGVNAACAYLLLFGLCALFAGGLRGCVP